MFSKEKVKIAFDALRDEKIDMWIIAGQESATNTEPILAVMSDAEFIGCTALIFCKDGTSTAVCTPIDYNGYVHHGVFDEVIAFPISFTDTLAEVIVKKKPEVIALDYSLENPSADGLSLGMYHLLEEAFEKANYQGKVVSAENIIVRVRGIKSEEELSKIRKACLEAEKIFDDAKDFIKPGMNCKDVYAFFQNEVERKGFGWSWPKSCNPGVFSGYGCPGGHMGAPDFAISRGDVVNIDFGIVVDGYGCDLQRMYYVLKEDESEAPKDIVEAFNTVRDGILLAAKALKPGVTGLEVDTVAREYITGKGYEDWNAALGHQMGRVAHDGGPLLGPEKPRYNKDELIRTPLFENMAFTLEPAIPTRAGRIGLEEDVVVKKDGAEFIVPPQKELYLI
ncbi:Xaa-Pro peptidase family protein [uncultured Traorella sp.]|uniref:M24 family metallopeptidase n=1 Tax=uncultured Traorella sp. TaxID=1929048 RepID=UPI0026008499|nr:Xaa-Pro peptidase family protein [uncultured Traorella sp.]